VPGVKADVGLDARLGLDRVEMLVELLVVDTQRDLAEQLDEAPVGIVREALVIGLVDQSGQRLLVEAEVQDRIHHARHRQRRTGAHGNQQGIRALAEGPAGGRLEVRDLVADLSQQLRGQLVRIQVLEAGLGRDHEAGRHVQADLRHFTEVGALAAEELLVLAVALRESVHELPGHRILPSLNFGRHAAGNREGTLSRQSTTDLRGLAGRLLAH
jgi:hypothetical protein